ncbi:MAG: outer membrane beta-barrel protein [Blastocatellia bacterium]
MRKKLGRTRLIAFVVCALGASTAHAQQKSSLEGAAYFGVMLSGREVARGANATGGHEQLIARLNHGGALGVRGGVHNVVLGLEVNFLAASSAVRVNNEFGARFPNHGKRPFAYSGDGLLYPFARAIRSGRVRPYLTSGIGGMLMSADLDNINDQELHHRLMWNAGGGAKLVVGEGPDVFLDLRFTNHRLLGSQGSAGVDLRSITVGVGYRF